MLGERELGVNKMWIYSTINIVIFNAFFSLSLTLKKLLTSWNEKLSSIHSNK